MTIAFLSHYDFNLYRFRLPIMKALIKQGHNVYAISPSGLVSGKFERFGIKHISYQINRQSLNPFTELKNIFNIYKAISSINLDILHTFTLKPNIYGSLVSFFLKHRVICSITGLGSFYIDTNIKSKIIKNITKLLFKIISLKSSYFIFQNDEDRNYFIKKNIIQEKKSILIRGSGIDTSFYNPENVDFKKADELKKKLYIQDTDLVITMIARIIIQKGVSEFVEAVNAIKDKYPNIKVIFIGDIDDGNSFIMDTKILIENDNINYFSFSDNIREFLYISNLYVLPSYREGLSMSLLEAISMQKAIVTTDVAGCKDVVDDGKNGFLAKVKDAKSLTSSIEKFINTQDKKNMGIHSREKAIKEFSVNIVIKQHLDLYKETIK